MKSNNIIQQWLYVQLVEVTFKSWKMEAPCKEIWLRLILQGGACAEIVKIVFILGGIVHMLPEWLRQTTEMQCDNSNGCYIW